MHGHGALCPERLLAPDGAVDHIRPKDPPRLPHQQMQDLILPRRQSDRLAVERDLLAPVVQAYAADCEHLLPRRPAAELQIAPQL